MSFSPFLISGGIDPTLLLHLIRNNNNVYSDQSSYARSVTNNNITHPNYVFSNSTDSFVGIPNADFGITTEDFVIYAKIFLPSLPSATEDWPTNYANHFCIFSTGQQGSATGWGLIINNSKISFQHNDTRYAEAVHGFSANTLYDIVCTRSGTNISIAINGNTVGSATNLPSSLSSGSFVSVGAEAAETSFFKGRIDEFTFTKSGIEILNLQYVNGWYTDTHGHAITNNNIGLVFNSFTSYLAISNTTDLTSLSTFTLEATIDCRDQYVPYASILSGITGWEAGSYSLSFDHLWNTEDFSLTWNLPGHGSSSIIASNNNYSFNTTRTVKVTFDGTTLKLYVDGSLTISNTYASGVTMNLAHGGGLRVGGGNWDGAQGYFRGSIDNLKIYNYAKN